MNATVQCLKKCHELKTGLTENKEQFTSGGMNNPDKLLTAAASGLFENLSKKGEPFAPI